MKKLVAIIVCMFFLLSTIACADGENYSEMKYDERAANFLIEISQVKETMGRYSNITSESDAQEMLELIASHADICYYTVHTSITTKELTVPETVPEAVNEASFSSEISTISTSWQFIEDENVYTSCVAEWSDNLLIETTTVCTQEGSVVGSYRIEYAKRETGEELVVFVGYNALYGTTSRIAFLKEESLLPAISIQTLGQVNQIRLNAEHWLLGIDPEEWSEELLYPVMN